MKLKTISHRLSKYLILIQYYLGLVNRTNSNAIFSFLFRLFRWCTNTRVDIHNIVLPLFWMDESTSCEKGILCPNSTGIAYGPHYIGRVQSTERVRLPDVHYHAFHKARICGTSSSVILNEKQVIIDRAKGPDQEFYDFATGHVLMHGADMAIVRLGKPAHIKNGIFLGGNGSSNYYHWIVEILAKLEFLSMLPKNYQQYPLLVSDSVMFTPSFKFSLDLFAKGSEIIVLKKEVPYAVDELIYINSPNNLPFNLLGNQQFKSSYVTINSRSIFFLRKIVLENAFKMPACSIFSKKIFLCRKGKLRNYNQDEIFNYLSMFGYTKVFMEDLSFLDQVLTAHHADYIVGPTGAAWTNLIFCRPRTKALCWMAAEFNDFSAYSSIAHQVGVDLKYLTYMAGVHSTSKLHYKDYTIDLSMIERGLSELDKTFRQPCD